MNRLIKVFTATIGICVIIVLLKDEYERNLLNYANYGLPSLVRQENVDNLYLGSSMFRQGIDISEANSHGGLNYVLAYNGNQPITEEWILKYLIQNEVSIDTLYVDMYVYSAYSEPQISDEKLFMEVGLSEKRQLYNLMQDVGIEEFLRIFVTANNETLLTWPIQSKLINQRFSQGGNVAETQGLTIEQMQQLTVPEINEEMNSEQVKAIKGIVDVAKQNNIEVIFIETPKYISVMENSEYQRAMKEYEDMMRQENVAYILARDVWNEEFEDAGNFIDLLHLSSQGRRKFTESLLDYLY